VVANPVYAAATSGITFLKLTIRYALGYIHVEYELNVRTSHETINNAGIFCVQVTNSVLYVAGFSVACTRLSSGEGKDSGNMEEGSSTGADTKCQITFFGVPLSCAAVTGGGVVRYKSCGAGSCSFLTTAANFLDISAR